MAGAEVVICGAGIAGVATAYELSVKRGLSEIVLVDERPPLSLTSDKSTECYRNWWPGPGDAMVKMMNRSIDLMEALAHESGNPFHLNRRGYLYITADIQGVSRLKDFAQEASALGAGPLRLHNGHSPDGSYQPLHPQAFEGQPDGADLITESALIREHFPYLADDVAAVLHVRRAGWLSAQQYGMYLLKRAREHGVALEEDRVEGVEISAGRVKAVKLASGRSISTHKFVNAAGPFLGQVGEMLGVQISVYNELHQKASFDDHHEVVPREAPMLIFSDEQTLDWTNEERALLTEDEETRWLTRPLPSGAHARPEGGQHAQTLLVLWDLHDEQVEPVVPPPLDPDYPELALRGMCRVIPGLSAYLERMPKPYLDGGYYTKTKENRPLASPLQVDGAFVIGATSGYGIMAAAALAELLAAHVTRTDLPDYAPAFSLSRYEDPAYQRLLADWGATWQL